MAVVSVTQRIPRDGYSESQRNGLLYEIVGRKYRVEFNVKTDSVRDGSNVVLKAAGLPKIGDPYVFSVNEQDVLATCVRVVPKAKSTPKEWLVEVYYDTDRLVSQITDNPLNQPPVLTWDFEAYERAMIRDVLGVPVTSSSRNALDPPPMQEFRRAVLRIVRNEAGFSDEYAQLYSNRLNKLEFNGYKPLCAKINYISGTSQVSLGVFYYSVTYEIEFMEEGFWRYMLDQDFRDIDQALFRDKRDYAPLSNPTPLNGRGRSIYDTWTELYGDIDQNATQLSISSSAGSGVDSFPPKPRNANIDGIIPGPYGDFQIKIDDEIINVTGGHETNTWDIERGYGGSEAATHAAGARIDLEPYYLKFLPTKYIDFTPLNLPVE